jgi:hypothetical protein
MVNFRRFNGTSDVVTLGLGTAINTITFGTMAVLCRRTDNTAWNGPFCTRSSAGDPEMYLDIAPSSQSPANVLWCSFGSGQNNNNAFTITAADDWVWVVITKATGSVAPRYHKYVMSTQTWTRGNGTGNVANATSPSGGSVQIGTVAADFFKGDIAAVAIWTTALSDAALNNIPNNWATGVLAASPQAAWLLNQASTATSIADATAGGANQTALSGTTVQSGTIANWAESGSTAISGTETSAGTETATLLATPARGVDTAAGVDTGTVVAAPAAGVESGAGAEAASVLAGLATGDTVTGTDSATLAATIVGLDTALATDTASQQSTSASPSGVETSSTTDTAFVSVTLTSSDAATGVDSAGVRIEGQVRQPSGDVRLLNGSGEARLVLLGGRTEEA